MLTTEQIQQKAPSVFAERPYLGVSNRYNFIPTIKVVDALRDSGFYPVKASESRARLQDKVGYTKHMLRFRMNGYEAANVGGSIPEVVLTNSHDTTSTFKLMVGLFRLVCSNGMVIAQSSFLNCTFRHSGKEDIIAGVIEQAKGIFNRLPMVMNTVSAWQQIQMSPEEQTDFGSKSIEVLSTGLDIQPQALLLPRRYADNGGDLWSVFNRVQENVIKGGLRGRNEAGRRMSTHRITAVGRDIAVNQKLWSLAEAFAASKN